MSARPTVLDDLAAAALERFVRATRRAGGVA